jgi:hypothetical protein
LPEGDGDEKTRREQGPDSEGRASLWPPHSRRIISVR